MVDLNKMAAAAAEKAEKGFKEATGPGEINPESGFEIGGTPSNISNRVRGALVGKRTSMVIGIAAIGAILYTAYGEMKDMKNHHAKDLSEYTQVQVTNQTSANMATLADGSQVSFGQLQGEGYIHLASPDPSVNGGDWSKVIFSGKDGISSYQDLQADQGLAQRLMEQKVEDISSAVTIDWAVYAARAEAKGVSFDNYTQMALNEGLDQARGWARNGFDPEVARQAGIEVGQAAEVLPAISGQRPLARPAALEVTDADRGMFNSIRNATAPKEQQIEVDEPSADVDSPSMTR